MTDFECEEKTIRINSILPHLSLCDGPGLRTVMFLQGCNLHCTGCHNKSSWDINGGKEFTVKELANNLRQTCKNKKLTISGGEPLLQPQSLLALCQELSDFDLCLYTGHDLSEVPPEILNHLNYIKTGQFQKENHTSIMPFVGSSNQKFMEIKHAE